ncbi:hypothetical protein IQ247_30335 [Plectonema cf. radiosum LEGE 06105]|uniref:Uncharacterized protein n=1 Tax=Plectonema cf. radiosum LEGE 06105 TaxID=945769 RepID=A0A8J7JWJ3_9CYAN|nr:hypothetical protein [Plectonema radiosum]MBE9216899.1 hypothetical protein [Plectonema cf. radiosum LEGE 06105]
MAQIQQTAMDDSAIASVEPNGFYQTPNSMAIKAINSKLTAADWALWSYLQMIDPFGDKMIELPKIPEIAEVIGVSFRQIKRSLSRLEELELYFWEPVLVRGQNLAGKKAKELCQQKIRSKSSQKNKMTNLDRIVQIESQNPSLAMVSFPLRLIQTLYRLSQKARERIFGNFLKRKQLRYQSHQNYPSSGSKLILKNYMDSGLKRLRKSLNTISRLSVSHSTKCGTGS